MKRILLLLAFLGLFFVTNVKADAIKIKSIEVVKKSDSVKEVKKPSFEGENLNLDLQLYKLGDYAEYKVVVQNTTKEDIVINNNGKKKTQKSDSIVYSYTWDNNDSKIKSGETKSFNLKVQYANKLAESNYDADGNYTKTDVVKIAVDQKKETVAKEITVKAEESPETGDGIIDYVVLVIIALVLIFDMVYFGIIKKENKKTNKILLAFSGVVLLISLVIKFTFAYKYASLNVTSNIKISKLSEMKPNCLSGVLTNDIIEEKFLYDELDEHDKNFNYNKCFTWENLLPITDEVEENVERAEDKFIPSGEKSSEEFLNNIGTKVVITTTKQMPEKYTLEEKEYTLNRTIDLSKRNDGSVMAGIYEGEYNTLVLIGGEGGVKAPEDSGWLFAGDSFILSWDDESLMELSNYGDFQNLDVSDTTNMSGMFASWYPCRGGKNFNVSTWKTPKLKYMNLMFAGMYYARLPLVHKSFALSLNNFDTSNVTEMLGTFMYTGYFSYSTNVKIDKWDTSNVKNMMGIFTYFSRASKKIINFDISKWDFSNVENATYAFAGAFGNLPNLKFDWSNFDFSKLKYAGAMFERFCQNCQNVDLNFSDWKTDSLQDISYMFRDVGLNSEVSFNLNASNWNVSNVSEAVGTFHQTGKKSSVFNLDLRNWNFKDGADLKDAFKYTGEDATVSFYYLNSMDLGAYSSKAPEYMFSKNSSYNGNVYIRINPYAMIYVKDRASREFVMQDTGLGDTNVIIAPIAK